MTQGDVWEHRVQIAGEERSPREWPTFYSLSEAENFAVEMRKIGVVCVAIHSAPLREINCLGGHC